MAEVPFEAVQDAVLDAVLTVAGPLTTGDSTGVLTINEGYSDVSVHAFGTAAGSTTTILGSLTGADFGVIDDAYGVPMSFTTLGDIKPVGPAVQSIKATVIGGSAPAVFVAVYIVKRR